jgi:uncharacterized protein involved in type VI secretion and phage assembly
MNLIPGVVSAVVKVIDKDVPGQVQLAYQWMSPDEPPSPPVRVAVPMAGGGRGLHLMPEVGDEVLVAFDKGDPRCPYVIGYLWNGQDKPPVTEPARRVLQTVSGHRLELDDTDGGEKVSLVFKGGGPGITITKDAITIRFSDSSFIKLSASELSVVNNTLVSINPT